MNLSTFRALHGRNYRLFFVGQSLSLLGTWMQKTAVSWVVYSVTQSKLMLGLSVFATLFPSAIFSFIGGVAADRYSRYRLLLLTQVLSMVQAVLLTVLVFFRPDAVWGIIGLSAVLGIINGFDVPARQSLVYELVEDKQDLSNALALNSSMVNLSKLIGPAIAGFTLEHLGEATCFGLNAVSFVAVIGSLLLMKLPAFQPQPRTQNVLGELRDGLRYVRDTPEIRFIISTLGLMSLVALPFTTLLPAYAKDIFHGTASTFGMVDGAVGLGAFIGALYLASLPPGKDLRRVLMVNTFVFGVGLLLFAYTPWFGVALGLLAVSAFGMMSQMTITNTLVQTTVAPAMRGRVISLYVMAFTGMLPLGSLLVGWVSEYVGVQATVLLEGVMTLAVGGIYWLNLRQRRTVAAREPAVVPPAPPVPAAFSA